MSVEKTGLYASFVAQLVSELHPSLAPAERSLVVVALEQDVDDFVSRSVSEVLDALGDSGEAIRHLARVGDPRFDAYCASIGFDFEREREKALAEFRRQHLAGDAAADLMPKPLKEITMSRRSTTTPTTAVRPTPPAASVKVKSTIGRRTGTLTDGKGELSG